jgi:hypothetical protein
MKAPKGLKVLNTRDLPTEEMKKPWPDKFVEWYKPRDKALFDEFEKTLNAAADERPLQEFLTAHTYLLALAFPVHSCGFFRNLVSEVESTSRILLYATGIHWAFTGR